LEDKGKAGKTKEKVKRSERRYKKEDRKRLYQKMTHSIGNINKWITH
jgi:hypothetical protein